MNTQTPRDFDVYADGRDPLERARGIIEMVRLAAQNDGDELRPEMLYETMLAVEDLLDTALAGLAPLMAEDEQRIRGAIQRVQEGER